MQRIKINGSHLNVRTIDRIVDTPSSLFFHGLNANMAFWHAQLIDRLSKHRRLILFDLPGHGYSDSPPTGYAPATIADTAREILKELDAERVDIVAHSFGASVALQFVRLFPEQVRSMTILDARTRFLQPAVRLGDWVLFERWRENFEKAGIHLDPEWELDHTLPLKFTGGNFSQACRNLAADGFFMPGYGPRSAEKYRKMLEETNAGEELQSLDGLTRESLRNITCPTRLVYGANSPFLETRDGLLKEIAGCTSRMVENAGHNFPGMMPLRTAEITETFWQETGTEDTTTRRRSNTTAL